ncbi:hypothetical protein GGR50DRAFT_98118 [Xylaria sp. CBS 124048]|nr:hypothetical protein GGR50DRAFT_98118 [Xylaria sp. CBS 124048]
MVVSPKLPSFAPFPESPWRDRIVPAEWEVCLSSWLDLAEAYLSLSENDLERHMKQDESVAGFLRSLVQESAASGIAILGPSRTASVLLRACFLLCSRLWHFSSPPSSILTWEFLSDFSRLYGKKKAGPPVQFAAQLPEAETSLQALKKSLILSLDAGVKGELTFVEIRLKRLNHLIYTSPHVAAFFQVGSDFLDGLISCFTIMNPPLRKVIITTVYLCLVGLTEGDSPRYSMLTDQLYSLKMAAEAHKAGPLNANDSMVAELVTATPILKQVQQRLEQSDTGLARTRSVIAALEGYRKPGANAPPKRFIKRKIDKGKGVMREQDEIDTRGEIRVHRMSQISQIQDLFPDLGSGFISQLLDEYGENTEQIIAHLLEDSLPPHLARADRTRALSPERTRRKSHGIAPRSTPPQIPARHNIYDDDELDRLEVDVSKLHFGKRNPEQTTDDILNDHASAPNKAAILSALSAFDADDDERDDTYDAADVGFAANDGHLDDTDEKRRKDANDEALFRAYQANPKTFERDAATRRSDGRAKLKETTGMTDEAIEGWAVMLARTPNQMKQLVTKYNSFGGDQPILASTAWRAPSARSPEEADGDSGETSSRGPNDRGRGRGRGQGRGRGRGGNVAGPSGDKETENARRRKEASKGSRANHNRRDQRAKKMSRGGFPA